MKECVTFRSPLEYDDLTFRETEKDNKKLHIAWGNNEMWTAVRPCEDSNKKYFLFVTHFCVAFVYCVVAFLRFSLRMGMAMSYIYLILA